MEQNEQITKMSIDLLIPNANQPRKIFSEESIKELATSIKEYGILNPILVRKKDNQYEIIAGERRYRAAKLLGLNEIPVIIKNVDDSKVTAIALIENLQRENISPIEEAKSYQEILRISNLKEQELSTLIGKSQPYISNKLRLLKLPQNIQDALINKKISERHARTLISVNDSEKQTELLNRVINEKLSVKELEKVINEKEITDEEIKSAIDDIMKSLNFNVDLNDQEKEEKESDIMNNNPNQLNNSMPEGNVTLNAMNMQTLNQTPNEAPQAFVYNQPTPEPQTPVMPEPAIEASPAPVTPEPAPMPALETPNPIPDFGMPAVEPPVMPESAPMPTLETPSPIPDFGLPQTPITPEVVPGPIIPEAIPSLEVPPVVPEPPLFDPNANLNPQPVSAPLPEASTPTSFEVPVANVPEQPQNKLVELENYLTSNGLNYKKYSNETGNCIIIEL